MAHAPLSRAEYEKLLQEVDRLVQLSKQRPADLKLEAYWEIGQRIAERKLSEDSGYGKAIVKDLASDVGLSARTLYDTLQFFRLYKQPPQTPELSWTHHRLLLRLGSKKLRNFYTSRVKEHGWSSRQLEQAIEAGLHRGADALIAILDRPDDPQYIYSATVEGIVDGDTLDLLVDLGFGVLRKLRARLANVNTPEIETRTGRLARDFVATELMSARTVVVKTIQLDLHGRYVVHLFYSTSRVSLATCFTSGRYLNDLLVQSGHAAAV